MQIIINAKNKDQILYSIYNLSGQVLISKELSYLEKGNNTIEIKNKFANGVYFISMLNVEGIYKEKFIVE